MLGAVNGALTIMAGGDAYDFERVRPLLSVLGSRVVRVGDEVSGIDWDGV